MAFQPHLVEHEKFYEHYRLSSFWPMLLARLRRFT